MQLTFTLHPGQLEVFNSPKRFKVVMAGRRFGKSFLACVVLLIEALKAKNSYGYDLQGKDVFYVAPTQQQARDIMWGLLKRLGKDVIASVHENTMVATLVNQRHIHLKGSDRPDSLRGVGLSYVVLDEYATMKPEVWELIIRPTLADVRGGALFIGTPSGENHFTALHRTGSHPRNEQQWQAFSFRSSDNPYLAEEEIEQARDNMSSAAFLEEFEGIPHAAGGELLDPKDIRIGPEPADASYVLAVDLAGFAGADKAARLTHELRRLDEHAIACVKVGREGWYVDDIIHGRWDIRETSIRILRAAQRYHPLALGIERGALKNAVHPYLRDQMKRLSVYPNVVDCTHGGKSKADRITWSLQGRLQHGRITFRDGEYLKVLKDQMVAFPNPSSHDDLLDALAYVDQLASTVYAEDVIIDHWEVLDQHTGY